MTIEEFDVAIYPTNKLTYDDAAVWLHNSFSATMMIEHNLELFEHAKQYWDSKDKLLVAGGAVFRNKKFASASGDAGWGISVYYRPRMNLTPVVLSIPVWPMIDHSRSLVWPWLAGLLNKLLVTMNAEVCFVNGQGDDEERERLPTDAEIVPRIPKIVTAYNFLGEHRIDQTARSWLSKLPAYESRPLGSGWLLRPVEDFSELPSPQFLSAFSKGAGGEVNYLSASLD